MPTSLPPTRLLAPPQHAMLVSWGLPLAVLLGVGAGSICSDHPPGDFTRDMAVVAGVPPYIGAVSNIGSLLWAAATTLALATAALLVLGGRRDESAVFFVLLGLLSGTLMVDDMFMVHEWVLPLVLGLPPWLLLVFQGAVLMVLLVRFRAVYLPWNLFFLGSALTGFTVSVAIDRVPDHILPGHYLLEDGFKLIGIVNWLAFTVQSAMRYVRIATA